MSTLESIFVFLQTLLDNPRWPACDQLVVFSLKNLTLSRVNLAGPIPDFLGEMAQLSVLELAYNNLSGAIPSTFSGSGIQVLQLNNQYTPGLSSSLDLLGTVQSLEQLWLHGNNFNGTIPISLAKCVSLKDIRLNQNNLIRPIPAQFPDLSLTNLLVDSNKFIGPIPNLKIPPSRLSYKENSFCQSDPGKLCTPEVTALLDLLATLNYPGNLAGSWAGNGPCNLWMGIGCANDSLNSISLPKKQLTENISPSLVNN